MARTQYAAALTGFHQNLIAVRQTYTGQIGTGLHQIDVLRHGKDAVVHGLQSPNELAGHFALHSFRPRAFALQLEDHSLFGHTVFFFHIGTEQVPIHTDALLVLHRDGTNRHRFTRYGIVQTSGLNVA